MYFVFSSGEDGWLLFTFLQKKSEAGGSYNKAEEGQCCDAALRNLAQAAPWLEYSSVQRNKWDRHPTIISAAC